MANKGLFERKFVCMKEAAEILGINVQTMKKILDSNVELATRLGRKILINKDKLMEYMENTSIIRYK